MDSFIDLDRRRTQLEKNVEELRKSLRYWQLWEAEYEGFKEEISGLGDEAKEKELEDVGVDFGGQLLDQKEITALLGHGKGQKRNVGQVIGLLSRRIDYVHENVKAIEKRLSLAEEKLAAVSVVIQPDLRNEEGLPVMEIREELDEEGNVLSSSLSTPADARTQIAEVLRKAGVKDIPELGKRKVAELEESLGDEEVASSTQPISDAMTPKIVAPDQAPERAVPAADSSLAPSEPEKQESTLESRPKERKKSVSFTPDTKTSDADRQPIKTPRKRVNGYPRVFGPPTSPTSESPSVTTKADTRGDDSDDSISEIVLPEEPPEDAALRRQMLKYGMEEVGSIVAQIDIDEGESTPPYSDDDDDIDYDDTTDEDEDQFGRTKKRVVGHGYREQMLELERKLNAKIMENVGPNADVPVAGSTEAEKDQKAEPEALSVASTSADKTVMQKKKGVRFAESLDISHAPSTKSKPITKAVPKEPSNPDRPIADSIVERTAPATGTSGSTPRPKKPSKFKAARSEGVPPPSPGSNPSTTPSKPLSATQTHTAISNPLPQPTTTSETQPPSQRTPTTINPPPIPSGPSGQIQSKILIERPPPPTTTTEPASPDEFDPALMHQELAVEYHRLRNRMIQRTGGFVQEEEEPAEMPIVDDEREQQQLEGGRKMSLFKAARLGML